MRHTNCKHAYALRHAMVTPEYDAAVRQPPPGWLAWSFERSLRWSTKKNKWVKDFARYAVETHDALARAALAGGRGNRYGYEHVREVNPSCVALDVECTVPDSNAAEATDAAASRYAAACARLGMSFSNLAALGDAMLEPILRALEEALPALRGAATLVSTAHGPDDGKYKYSFHVKYPGFKLPTQEARTRFGKRLKALEPLVDASVYSANHLMRMLGSAKRGSTRVLVPRGAGPEHEPSVEEVVQHMWCFVPPDTLELPLDDEQDDAPGPSDGAVPAKRPKRSAGAQKAAGKLAPELEAALLEVVATAPPPLRMRPVFQSTAMDDAEITVTCDYAGGSYVCPCGDEHDSNSARLRIKRSDGAVTFNCFHRGTGKFHAIGAVPRRLLPPQALTGVAAWYADVLRRVGLTPLWFDDARVERMARYDAFYRDARFVDAEGPCPVCGAEHGRYVVCTHVKRRGAGMVRTCILTWAVNDAAKTCLVQPDVQSDLAWVRRTHPDAEPWQLDELSKCLKFGMPLTPLEEVPPVAAAGATA